MNILLVTYLFKDGDEITHGGVEYYRMTKPHAVLKRYFPEYELLIMSKHEFDLKSGNVPTATGDMPRTEWLTEIVNQFDLIIFNREMPQDALDLLESLGKPYALDLDDYWILPGHHELSEHYRKNNIPEQTVKSIKGAKFVMCSTPILAEKIKEHNDNVYVVENGIDSGDEIWQPRKVASPRLRFGFTQGTTHYEDLKMLQVSVRKAMGEYYFRSNGQIVMCGFGVPKKDDECYDWSHQNIFQHIELLYTDGHRLIGNKEHVMALRNYEPYNDFNTPFRRILGKPILEFPSVYNEIDVSVVPLKVNTFNSCKSELKMLEAGFMGCAVMVSHVKPYTLLATDKNSFDLNKKTFREWAKYLIQNRNLVSDTAAQLRLDVERYDLKHLSVKRNEIYKKYV